MSETLFESLFSGRSEIAATHDLRPDPTHALSSAYRETCARCGASALRYRSNEYGSALEQTCEDVRAYRDWQEGRT